MLKYCKAAIVALFLASATIISGCATLENAFKDINAVSAAKTTEQKAYALYGTYVIAQEQAVNVVKNKKIPAKIRRSVKSADAAIKPVMDLVLLTARKLVNARRALAQGNSTSDTLNVELLSKELADYVTRAGPLVDKLVSLVAQYN